MNFLRSAPYGLRSRLRALLPGTADLADARRDPRRDLLSGITVAVVALPLALAFGIASGAGAGAGLATAIVAGMLAAVCGGSNLQVSGPTGAMTVVLIPIVALYGTPGVLMVGLLAGLILLVLAIARIGRFVRFLPMPVVEGFTAGIAVVIAFQQVPNMLGVEPVHDDKVWMTAAVAFERWLSDPDYFSALVAICVAAVILIGGRWRPMVPFSLLAVVGATVVAPFLPVPIARIGEIPAGLPLPSLGFFDAGMVPALLPSALAVAVLAALESLLCASVADTMSGTERHDPDRELFGQGLANLAAPLFGGIPATAAIARTAVNVRAGARSRLAALTHALVLAGIVFGASGLVEPIPLAALAGVLLATTIRMVELRALYTMIRSDRGEAAILLATFAVTVVFDLVTAVGLGILLSIVLAVLSTARNSRVQEVPLDLAAEERGELVAYQVIGPLFFAAAHRLLLQLDEFVDARVLILHMARVPFVDWTGAASLAETITRLEQRGVTVLLSQFQAGEEQALIDQGPLRHLDLADQRFPTLDSAVDHARYLLHPVLGSDGFEEDIPYPSGLAVAGCEQGKA